MSDIKELKILLAEDDPLNQRIAVLTFNHMGVSIDVASNGMEAFEMCCNKKYHLILMDLQMPDMDGIEATRLIRNYEKETNSDHLAYIVALSGNIISEMKEECLLAGMDDYIEKPFQEQTMRDLFSKFLD